MNPYTPSTTPTHTSGDTIFFDSGSPPKIFTYLDYDPELRHQMDSYKKLRKGYDLYALTLTLTNKEKQILKLSGMPELKYLRNKLQDLKIPGIYITENTKKQVKHLHGIASVQMGVELDTNSLFLLWKASVKVKRIIDYENYLKWQDYMCKELMTPDIDKWMNISLKDQS